MPRKLAELVSQEQRNIAAAAGKTNDAVDDAIGVGAIAAAIFKEPARLVEHFGVIKCMLRITASAIAFILLTQKLGQTTRYACLGFMAIATGYAVVNNVQALSALGLSPLGIG